MKDEREDQGVYKIKITGDSTMDLSKELLQQYDMDVIPLYINMEEQSSRDGIDIVPDDIYSYVNQTGKLSKTSAPTIEDYTELFRAYKKDYDAILHFNISSDFSSAHQNAMAAAAQMEGVYPIDSRSLSSGTGILAIEAAAMAQQGMDPQSIVDEIQNLIPKVEISFLIDTLVYLHKGGRCSSVAMLGANVLKLKPCIEVIDGRMLVGKKYRGSYESCVMNYVRDRLSGRTDIRTHRIFCTHTRCENDLVTKVLEETKQYQTFTERLDTWAGCTVTNHCGPGTLGIIYIRK